MSYGLTPIECAKILGCSKDQVRAFIDAGELPAVNIGLGKQRARYRVQQDELEAFILRRTSRPLLKASQRGRMPQPKREWV